MIRLRYEKLLSCFLKHRIKTLGAFTALLAVLILLSSSSIHFRLDEDLDPDFFSIVIEAQEGIPLEDTNAIMPEIEQIITEIIPGDHMQSIITEVGHHNTSFFGEVAGLRSHWALVTVNLIPSSERTMTSEAMIQQISRELEPVILKHSLERCDVSKIEGLPVGSPVEAVLVCDDDTLRHTYEQEIISFLESVDGITNIQSSRVPGKDEIRLVLDHVQLARAGLTSSDVASTVRAAFEGIITTEMDYQGESIGIRVRLENPDSYREEKVLEIPVANAEGRLVALKHFASIRERKGEGEIHHRDVVRSTTVSANVDPDIITSAEANAKLQDFYRTQLPQNPDIQLILGGEQEETASSMQGFLLAAIVVIISIYFLLVIVFDSYTQPFLMMSIIPFAVTGTLVTLMIHGRPLIMLSLLGMLGLIGVVVNDTIVMISHLNDTFQSRDYSAKLLVTAAADRFRPVILTTLTTFVGLLPTAYGLGGDIPSIRPMVLVMAWGILFCTLVTLFFTPLLYSLFKREA